jgi:outer membrane protein, heavy metal efflux system
MSRSLSLLSLFLFTSASPAVTLDGLPAHVRQTHPELKAARLAIDEARGRQLAAGRLSNPEASLDFSHDRRIREGTLTLSFEQRFPLTARLRLEKQLSTQLVEAAEMEVKEHERHIIAQARTAAVELLAQQMQMDRTKKQQDAMKQRLEFVSARVAEGELSALDEAQLKLEVQRLALELKRQESELGRLRSALRLATGTEIKLTGELPPIGRATAGEKAWQQRPDYRLAEIKQSAASTRLELARAKKWQDIGAGIFAGGDRHEDGVNGLEQEALIGFRITLPLPFWDKNEGEIAEKSAGVERSALELKALSAAIRNEVTAAREAMTAARELEAETREKLLPLMEEQLKRLEQAYENAQADLIAVQQAREQRLVIESTLVDAARDYHLAKIRHETATGHNP